MSANLRTTFCAFFGTGLLVGFSAIHHYKKRIKTMANYTITATITKIDSDGKIILKGVGKCLYEKSKDECLNFLECNDFNKSKLVVQSTPFELKKKDEVSLTVFAMAMLQKKPLKLTIEENEDEKYAIIAVEVP